MTSMFPDFLSTDDPRMGHILSKGVQPFANMHQVCIVGFPYDEGVARNNGRIGAAQGPQAALKYIKKVGAIVNSEYGIDLRKIQISSEVNEPTAQTLEQAHEFLHTQVRDVLLTKSIPFVIGGGNDQSFINASALMSTLPKEIKITVINIDAHLDVRPKLIDHGGGSVSHSGSPFRQLLESTDFQARHGHLIEYAVQGSQCSAEHCAYLNSRNNPEMFGTITELVWLSDIVSIPVPVPGIKVGNSQFARDFHSLLDRVAPSAIFVSFDLDSVMSSDAPGVSCASPLGLSAQHALDICYVAGTHPSVKLFDLSEYNPKIEEYRTGRLVAFMFYHFCLGLASRPV